MGDARIRQVKHARAGPPPTRIRRPWCARGSFAPISSSGSTWFPSHLPALRERTEDVPRLAEHFLVLACRHTSKNVKFSEAALVTLQLYDWPGNVAASLENMVERLVILSATDTIGVNDLPDHVRTPLGAPGCGRSGDHRHAGRSHRSRRDLVAHSKRRSSHAP